MEKRWLEAVLKLAIGVTLLVLLNILAKRYFVRLDFTEEKRFTLTEPTRDLLSSLEDDVFVEVYLEGDLPSGFRRLRNATAEMLESFRAASDNRVQFVFTDPQQGGSVQAQNEYMMAIAQKGIQPTDVTFNEGGQRIQKRILPGAVVSYGGREKGVLLLKGNLTAPSEIRLNQSVEGLEFELANTILSLTKSSPEVLGLATGHGELTGSSIEGLRAALQDQFVLREVSISRQNLEDIDLLIIPKPVESFSASEVFYLDQYVMSGGKLILLLDALMASMDSTSISIPYELNLDDMLFRYGVRINKDLVLDMLSAQAPVVIGNLGESPQIQLLPWPFFPITNSYPDHPVVRNMDAVKLAFASSMDTVKAEGIEKTPLLMTSANARTIMAPIIIDLDELKKPMNPQDFQTPHVPMAYLLEGTFTSAFKNRPTPVNGNFSDSSIPTKVAVIADGDLVRNEFNPQNGRPLPLGFEPYTRLTYANETFMLNLINYMLDEDGLIISRNKEVVLRPLNKQKVVETRTYYQIVNTVVPLVLLALFGWVWNVLRKRMYTR